MVQCVYTRLYAFTFNVTRARAACENSPGPIAVGASEKEVFVGCCCAGLCAIS